MIKAAITGLILVLTLPAYSQTHHAWNLGIKINAAVLSGAYASLFREGTEVSRVSRTFAGPVCAKDRIEPEFDDPFDGTGLQWEERYAGHGIIESDLRKKYGVRSTKLIPMRPDAAPSYFRTRLNFSPALDLRRKSMKITFFIPDDHNISNVNFLLTSSSATRSYQIWYGGGRSPRTGWIEFAMTSTHGFCAWDQNFDLSNITRLGFAIERIDHTLPAYILVNGLTVWDGRLKTPLYCLTFDDNYIRQYEAAKYAAGKGIPTSLFINKFCFEDQEGNPVNPPRGVAAGSEGMTLAQNQELAALGCVHINHGVSHHSMTWRNPQTSLAWLINDIEENRRWLDENGLGFAAGIWGTPQEWWLDLHEENLLPYMFGRPRQGRGIGSYGLLTLWDEHTEVRAACDTHLANAYTMLANNVGTPENNFEDGDKAIQIDVWHHYASHANEGSLQDFKDYIDVVASHIAAGRLKAVTLKELYEHYLYSTSPENPVEGDVNYDGVVNLGDLSIVAENWLAESAD